MRETRIKGKKMERGFALLFAMILLVTILFTPMFTGLSRHRFISDIKEKNYKKSPLQVKNKNVKRPIGLT